MFNSDFEMVHSHLKNIEKLVEEWINDLYQHLLNNDILISQVCFSWVLTLMSVFVDVQNMVNLNLFRKMWSIILLNKDGYFYIKQY